MVEKMSISWLIDEFLLLIIMLGEDLSRREKDEDYEPDPVMARKTRGFP